MKRIYSFFRSCLDFISSLAERGLGIDLLSWSEADSGLFARTERGKMPQITSDNPKSPSKYRLTVNSKQLLIVTIALLLCGSKVSAHDFEVNGIYYKITTYSTDLTVTVTHKGSLLDNHSNDYKGEVSIPATTTFDNKTYSVTSIGDYAFANCSSLTSITIPKSVTSIGASAFSGCSSLSSVNIPSAVTTIGNNAFYGCSSLVTIDIPTSVSFVGDKAFSGTQIVFPEENGIRYIGAIAHTLTDRTLTEYKLKEGTVTIAAGLFKNCTNLQSVHIPNSVDSIGFQAFYGCSNLPSIILPESVLHVGNEAFSWCNNLTSVNIPEGITSIGDYTFFYCRSITSITLPNGVMNIGKEAFAYCRSLNSIILPESMAKIGSGAFYWCRSLTLVTCRALTPSPLMDREFDGIPSSATLLIPQGSSSAYEEAGWSSCFSLVLEEKSMFELIYTVDGEVFYIDSIAYGSILAEIEAPTKEGYTFSGWSQLPETMPAKDLVIIGTFTANKYFVIFKIDDVEIVSDSLECGAEILAPTPLEKEGYTFDGWSELPERMPAHDVTIIGSFSINTYKVTYMVDDEEYYTDSIVYAESLAPIADPVKEGYTFEKWVDLPATMPAKDVVVKGAFSVNSYKITYVLDGEFYGSDSIAYNEEIIPLEVLDREGYTFSGWLELPKTMPAGDLVIEGSFTINSYTITYMVDGKVYKTVTYNYGETVTAEEDLEKDGYVFSGWAGVPEIMPAGDVVVVGVFALNKNYTDEQGVLYSLKENKDGYTVSSMTQISLGQIIIPAEINELPVTAIDDRAFMGTKGLTSIVIPANITTIGEDAFYGCRELLLVEWNTKAPLMANCFDEPVRHGNMLVVVTDTTTEIGYQGNVVVNGVAEQITISDDMAFRSPQQFTARKISFTRDFTKKTKIGVTGGWEAMVLPFDVQSIVSKEKGELKLFGEADFTTSLPYWLGELQADGTFAATQRITANKPFIMQLPNSDEYRDIYNVEGEVTFSATNVTVLPTTDMEQEAGNGYVMLGSYEGTTADSRVYALNDEEYTADGETYMPGGVFVAHSRDIRPFEAYVYTTNAGRAPYLRVDNAGETGIGHSTFNVQHSTEIYDLTGRKVLNAEQLKGGIYIVNGKKVIIK